MDDCEAGCVNFTCGSIKHLKECKNYHDSMSQMVDERNERIEKLESALSKLIDVAQECDGWESFPSSDLDEANKCLGDKL